MSRSQGPTPTLSMRDPMAGPLARLDDPWGITWRAVNLARRLSARRSARFLWALARGVRHERPVFVLGAPRSGTTLVFELLRASHALGSLPGEGHDIWRTFHHPRWSHWDSDHVAANDVRPGERRVVSARLYAHFDSVRFVEKTPENSLRVPYLLRLFPDARFLVVKRNPCEVVNSLINGWRHPTGKYRSYFVPEDLAIPGYAPRRQWCFALIDGWRDHRASPVHEIAFAQWEQSVRALQAVRDLVLPERWTEVQLEDILAEPAESLIRICRAAEVQRSPALERRLATLVAQPLNALSAPGRDKWRSENGEAIRSLLPRIAAAARGTGYSVDPATGEVGARS
jgi:hypothetical protein